MKPSKITSSKYFIPASLFLLCILLYGNTLHNEYAEDDNLVVTQNKFIIKGFSAFKDIWDKGSLYGAPKAASFIQQYRPLTLLNFMTEVSIFGLNPHVGHFFNVLFFAITVVLLYFFLQKILKNYNQSVIIAATLLFAFHPIHTEVVANIKSRDEILALLFGLLSFYFIMLQQEPKWQGRFPSEPARAGLNRPYIFSLLAFFASLFCKESAFTYIAIIPLLLYFFTGMKFKKIALKTVPYIILGGIYLFIRTRVLQNTNFLHQIPINDNTLMAANSNAERTATSFVLLGKYMYMSFIPYPLSWNYSYNQIPVVSWENIKPIFSLFICIALIGYAIWGLKKKSVYSFLIAFFFITLSVSSNFFIKIAATFGERFLYMPSLAFCIALPVFIGKRFELTPIVTRTGLGCVLVVYTLIVIPRNAEWKNNFTLCSSGVITSPNSAQTHAWLAGIYADTALNSKNPIRKNQYFFLAAHEYKRTVELELYATDTNCYWALGYCYFNAGYYDSAIPVFNKVLEFEPKNPWVLHYLGLSYLNKRNYNMAISYFSNSYMNDSTNLVDLIKIAECCQGEGNFALALHYDSLLLIKAPASAPTTLQNIAITHNNMGLQFLNNNESDKALEEFKMALNISPDLIEALKNMAIVYNKMGNRNIAEKYEQMVMKRDRRI